MALTDDEAVIHDLLRMARRQRGESGRREIGSMLAELQLQGLTIGQGAVVCLAIVYRWANNIDYGRP